VKCSLKIKELLNIKSNRVKTHIYYIINEAVNNSIKHGKAKNIDIELNVIDGGLNVTVKDDGLGIKNKDLQKMDYKGMGLKTMQYRAKILGADFYFFNEIDQGFVINFSLSPEIEQISDDDFE
jgi:signal transduction histidine kinase